jgi:hypothetical protein
VLNDNYDEAARVDQNTISTLEGLGIAQRLGGHTDAATATLNRSLAFSREAFGEENGITRWITLRPSSRMRRSRVGIICRKGLRKRAASREARRFPPNRPPSVAVQRTHLLVH